MDFKEAKAMKVEELEAKYISALANKDQSEMDLAVGRLMAIKGIEIGDPRIASLKKRKIPNFSKDYRVEGGFVSEWVYGKAPSLMALTLTAKAHEGVRIEGNYEGQISVPERTMRIEIRELKSSGLASTLRERLMELDKKCSHKPLKLSDKFNSRVAEGRYAVYTVGVGSGQNFLRKDMGYIIVSMGKDDVIKVIIELDQVNLTECSVDAKIAEKQIANLVKAEIAEVNDNEVSVRIVESISKTGEADESRTNKDIYR